MIVYLLDISHISNGNCGKLPVQISDGFPQKVDTHGAETSACATETRRPVDVVDDPIQTHVHRVEGEETAVWFVVVEAFVVGDVHLHR